MSHQLSHTNSPLHRARRQRRVALKGTKRQLSTADQVVIQQLLTQKYECVPHKSFGLRDAERKIFEEAPEINRPDTRWYHPVMEAIAASPMKTQTGSVLLTSEQECYLFKQFNYCRYKVTKLRDKILREDARQIDAGDAREMLRWYYKGERYRDQIAQTNLALVLAMAKRTRLSEVDFADLISEGNMALLRAVDKFDVARGFKFSTYACRAILKAFSRIGIKVSKYRNLFPTDFDPTLEKSDFMQLKRQIREEDCVDELRQIIADNRAELTEIERSVLHHRFALTTPQHDPDDEAHSLTLEQVGKIIGVTKERVRQIQNKALEKIRNTLEEDFLA
ncbi:MAG: sigma-70 family RNA polymerase sigma factor [Phycisphaeraceae bacterium]|jgi:RNA polymerase sigma factor (sigma-70 family)|nr:sigma-70 family RNA polymerase sigma factor [Phycisphaeraceae bacterium]